MTITRTIFTAAAITLLAAIAPAQAPVYDTGLPQSISANVAPTGYSVGNFGMAAALDETGLKATRILLNTPVLGEQLEPLGSGELRLTAHGQSDFTLTKNYSVFPENYSDLTSQSTGVTAHVETFAPICDTAPGRTSFNSFLPAIVVQVTLANNTVKPQSIDLAYLLSPNKTIGNSEPDSLAANGATVREVHRARDKAQVWLMAVPDAKGAATPAQPDAQSTMHVGLAVNMQPHQSRVVSFVFGVYDARSYTSAQLTSRHAQEQYILTGGVQNPAAGLARQHTDFLAMLPHTGDAQLDVYLRWYLSAAVLLTKGLSTGDVLTMGYAELNQRDSFWTSGAHLVLWPDLERKMLEESMKYQDPNGQIPMTILPVIRRANNVDGNEYFLLRLARYYEWNRDEAFLKEAMPHVKRAIDYLVPLDREKIGLPMQVSFWADWKDVQGVEGRTYAPHFDLLWLATLKKSQELAHAAGDKQFEEQLAAMYDQAYERINRDVAQGGMWDSTRYVDLWKDGRRVNYTLEDQSVAALFGVIPHDRLESLYKVLDTQNEGQFGVRDTYPYITTPFKQEDYGQAQYHNGGIWPWLNFADAWGRYTNGHAADAERILKKVGYNDLVRRHDYIPNEFLNGETGKNEGEAPQGWDADFFSAIYFGAFGLNRISAKELDIHVNLTGREDFTTTLRIPEGDLQLSRRNGKLKLTKKLSRPVRVKIIPN